MGSSPRRLLPVPRCTRGAGGTFNSSTSRSARPRPHPSRPAAGVGRQPFGNPAVRALLRGCRARPPLPRPGWGCGRRWRGDVHVGNGLGRPPRREEPGRRRPRRFQASQEKLPREIRAGSLVCCLSWLPPGPGALPAPDGRKGGRGRTLGTAGDLLDRVAAPRGASAGSPPPPLLLPLGRRGGGEPAPAPPPPSGGGMVRGRRHGGPGGRERAGSPPPLPHWPRGGPTGPNLLKIPTFSN